MLFFQPHWIFCFENNGIGIPSHKNYGISISIEFSPLFLHPRAKKILPGLWRWCQDRFPWFELFEYVIRLFHAKPQILKILNLHHNCLQIIWSTQILINFILDTKIPPKERRLSYLESNTWCRAYLFWRDQESRRRKSRLWWKILRGVSLCGI